MKKVLERVLLAVIVVPLLVLFSHGLTHWEFLLLNVTCVALTLAGALEVRGLFEHRCIPTDRWLAPILGASLPAASYLQAIGLIGEPHLLLWVAGAAGLILLRGVWTSDSRELEDLLVRTAASLAVVLYPGIFMLFISRVTTLENASFHLLFLFALVFGNDSAAWAVGTLFGKPAGLLISPGKSVAGFAAGLAASLAAAVAASAIAPSLVPGGLAGALLIGVVIGVTVILGDLVESALKRSAGVKDSGTLMMGRGGLLDSADSLLLAAPLYYFLVGLLAR